MSAEVPPMRLARRSKIQRFFAIQPSRKSRCRFYLGAAPERPNYLGRGVIGCITTSVRAEAPCL